MAETQVCIAVDWSCYGDDEAIDAIDETAKERAELFAQSAILILTGRQVGNCPVTVRPCVAQCAPTVSALGHRPWMTPYIANGVWYNTCGCRPQSCACSRLTTIVLPGPIGAIEEVKVDGEVVDPDFYVVTNNAELVRLAGPEWPTCQEMADPDTAVGTMSVAYTRGAVLDSQGELVAGILAKEYLNACNDLECRLPSSVVSLARQGVSFELGDSVFPNNKTGIDVVDLWVQSWNPYGVKAPARVYSVDVPEPFRATWSA